MTYQLVRIPTYVRTTTNFALWSGYSGVDEVRDRLVEYEPLEFSKLVGASLLLRHADEIFPRWTSSFLKEVGRGSPTPSSSTTPSQRGCPSLQTLYILLLLDVDYLLRNDDDFRSNPVHLSSEGVLKKSGG